MRIMVLGGDGFTGWPTSLHLAQRGHDIHIVDDLSRRKIDIELEVSSLTPIASLSERRAAWNRATGKSLSYTPLNVAEEYEGFCELLCSYKPEAIVHLAELKSAPYSMRSSWHKRLNVNHNVSATHNVLCAIVENGIDAHIVHLGTMGVYGYGVSGASIPEGYLKVHVQTNGNAEEREILHPTNPGSIYHLTKTLDQLLFAYYNKNDKVRVTDLHQGIVWGTFTEETKLDEQLVNRFDYDGDYGTVLNRFLMQAAIDHPITVHGTGGQTRAFIHIRDTVRCIELAATNPPARGERVRIFNQMTETHRVRDLAEMIARKTGTPINWLNNPRNEASENELVVENDSLISLGLQPTRLEDGLLEEVMDVARRYANRCDRSKIIATVQWTRH
jgi:UDP-sulfoquinovose synthase